MSPSQILALDDAQVDLWVARDPQLRDAALLESFSQMLSPDEQERVARMRFEAGRHQQLVTRALVRSVLSRYAPGVLPADWRFARSEEGRPHIEHPARTGLHFNLAHTRGLVVLAVSRLPEIGVDVERHDTRADPAVARRYFSPAEVAALDALPAAEQPRRFRRLWTLKEAYLKATGAGIAGGLDSMSFDLEAEYIRFACPDPMASHWQFREFTVDGHFMVALASLDRAGLRPPQVTLREFSGEEKRAEPEQGGKADAVGEGGEDHAG
jgi:4'-phosphopantetheinyl transferase